MGATVTGALFDGDRDQRGSIPSAIDVLVRNSDQNRDRRLQEEATRAHHDP